MEDYKVDNDLLLDIFKQDGIIELVDIVLDENHKGKIGTINLKGKVDDTTDIYRDIKYNSVAEQDLNIIINCLSKTEYGRKLSNFCRGKKILINISLETDPYA